MIISALDNSRLEALLESAQLLHSSLNLEDLLRHLLRSVMGRLLVSKALIAIAPANTDEPMRLEIVRGVGSLKVGNQFHANEAQANGIDLLLHIGDIEAPVGVLGLGKPANRELDEGEIEFVKALLGIAASGIANARAHAESHRLNQALDQKVQDMQALIDLGRGLTSTFEAEEVARLLALTLAGRWAVRKYAVAAWKKGHPPVLRQKGMSLDLLTDYDAYGYDPELLEDAVRATDLPEGVIRDSVIAEQGAICFPIKAGDNTTGGLVVMGPRPGNLPYSEADLEFGAGLVAQAAVALENAWYFRGAVERKKVEQELQLAASIQEGLFPATLPKLVGYDIAARNRPARHCGGDYYDMLTVAGSDSHYLLCVADVSGKGLPASLLMSNMQATLRALLGRVPSLTELAALTNEMLHATTPSNKYVTAILVEFDPATGKGIFVNAGHQDCLLLRGNGEAQWLKSTGTPLGLLAGLPYDEQAFELNPGELIALFSDGVTEAQDEHENEFGETATADFIRTIADESACEIVEKVFCEIDRFAGAAPQYDDITLMVIKRMT